MHAPIADFRPVRFSAADMPERDRVRAWRDFFGPSVFHTEIEPEPDMPFQADVSVRCLPGLLVVSNVMSAARFHRTAALAADGNDHVALVIASSGGSASQRGRELATVAGDGFIMNAAEPGRFVSPPGTQFHCFHLHMPRVLLSPLVPDLDDAFLRSIPRGTEALRYLLSYVRLLEEEEVAAHPELARLTVAHVRDLLALVLGATPDATAMAEGGGLRAARLRAIKDGVARHCGDHGLCLGEVAAGHRLSPRYVQRLFETEGMTFSEFLLGQRLARAHRMLAEERYAGWTVSAIAFEAGFGDVSYFNRSFRRRFGGSPTEIRAQVASGRTGNVSASPDACRSAIGAAISRP